jgi:hypothetical protein
MKEVVSSDFFVVRTVFFRVLFVFVMLSHERRQPVHVAVTEHSTSEVDSINYSKRSYGTEPRGTCCGIKMVATGRSSVKLLNY